MADCLDFKILLVDDCENDLFFLKTALEQSGISQSVNSVTDGSEAINYLSGHGKFSDRNQFPFPSVILSDLKMRRLDGFGLLRWLKKHPDFSVIPTLIFSSS